MPTHKEENAMKKSMISALLALTCVISMTACKKTQPDSSEQNSISETKSAVQSEINNSSVSSGDIAEPNENTEQPITNELSVSDARRIVAETIDTENYLILDGKTRLEIGSNAYHIFIIANKSDNKALGQIAVDCKTGQKYNYKGENTLEDYSTFQLYDPTVDMKADWEGIFTDGTRTLELLPMDDKSFEYMLDDGADGGVAQATGNTAKDISRDVTFTYGEDGSITISGEITGVFTR